MFCSIELTVEQMAVIAGTLANTGVCPTTGETVFEPRTVRNCLSLMASCGMYDFSGEFAFNLGFPAKSGVSGALMIVIPGVMVLIFILFYLFLFLFTHHSFFTHFFFFFFLSFFLGNECMVSKTW